VTGAPSGIGRAIALGFAREQAAYVLCADLRPSATGDGNKGLLDTHDLIDRNYGAGRGGFRRIDVTVEDEVRATMKAVVERAGSLDV
jgi:NAD(P)-dependent dehydrogenase (short-subunit alcohol dehydrogenase family)